MKLLLKCAVQARAGLVVVKNFDAVNYGSQLKAAVKVDIVNADNFKTFARCRHEDYCYVHELLNSEIFHPLATFELIL